MEAVGLKTHIWNNNLRSTFLLAGFPVLLLVIIYVLATAAFVTGLLPAGPEGALVDAAGLMIAGALLALLVAGVWFLIAWFANTAIVAMATGARPVTRVEQPELYNILENLAISRGLAMPRLNIIDTDALNAFASGVHKSQYTVTVTSGLLNTLNKEELEAVLGHELTHIINRDVRTMMIAAVFAGIFTLASELFFQALRFGRFRARGKNGGAVIVFILIAVMVLFVGRILAVVVRMTLSRSREFVADAGSVELTKNPDAMISALRKISGHSQLNAPDEVRGMFIDNGDRGVMSLFATHPPIEARIKALVQYTGGHDAPLADHIEAAPIVQDPAKPWGHGGPWG
ncbi:MAG: M48 family metallopeptidase [Alphaproteobacteria bacterium]